MQETLLDSRLRRLRVLVREVRCGDGVAARELRVFCHRRQMCIPVQQCCDCAHCLGFSLDPSGRRSTLQCDWQDAGHQPPLGNGVDGDTGLDGRNPADTTPVSQIMAKEVVCVTDDLSLHELTRLFLDRGISGVPVVDARGRAVGVVSKTDLVRQSYEHPPEIQEQEPQPLTLHDRAGISYELDDSFHDVVMSTALVRDVMTPIAYTLRSSTSIAQAAALMAFEGIHRLPIIADAGTEVVGLLSSLDVLRWLAEQHAYLQQRDDGGFETLC